MTTTPTPASQQSLAPDKMSAAEDNKYVLPGDMGENWVPSPDDKSTAYWTLSSSDVSVLLDWFFTYQGQNVLKDKDVALRDKLKSQPPLSVPSPARSDKEAERLDAALATFLAEHTRLSQDGIDEHAARMALALNHAANKPVPEADIEEWYEQGLIEASMAERAPSIDFRERFADAYKSLTVAAFNSPFWSQSMEELLRAVESEIQTVAARRAIAGNAEPGDLTQIGAHAWFHRGMVNFDAEDVLATMDDGKGTPIPLYLASNVGAAPGWIDTDERLPPDHAEVIILYWPYNNRENVRAASSAYHVNGTFYNEDGNNMHPPSHWMPLNIPAAPSNPPVGAKE